ncbi:M42 family metallopeptidase [Macrococcus bovicus]|uniref:M42 family peptidase n=1 Tax=Macrococcus bovicus TaxID=69968 RepID=A0A4R6C3H8_9STAP|nr:M42 family metallopeptidase [Macrococcus bovicus]TDM15761.1 M42 family peptidase [Macrococcus bovicus]
MEQLDLFKRLTDCNAVSGFERPMTNLMREYLEPLADDVITDNTGSIFGRKGEGRHAIMLAGHLDEIGFMVTAITGDGFIKFTNLGYWWANVMLSQKVTITGSKGDIRGVIGGKPPHVLGVKEKELAAEVSNMFIDIGVDSREEALAAGVRIGDPITPYSEFEVMTNPDYLLAKAWDNRFGCALAVEALRDNPEPNLTLYSGAVTQEETLSRGAKTAAHKVKPSLAIALDVGICAKTPGMTGNAKMGDGPIIVLVDAWHIGHPTFRQFVTDVAEKHGIKVQFDYLTGGYTDAGHIAQSFDGIPAITIGVPTRYIHSNVSMMNRHDYNGALSLVNAVLAELTDDLADQIIDQTYEGLA